MNRIIECVPNFSEGINADVIAAIANSISSVNNVKLLNVDPGRDANRTVITFAGEPEGVIEAAFQAIKTAGELIDMRTQKGEHPRMGATDVCPLVPVKGITMHEVVTYANRLAERVGNELGIPVYLYEYSQPDKSRSNLSIIRSGEYEGFFDKMKRPGWQPDFGPAEMNAKSGATVIGARNYLVAYNITLDTKSVPLAKKIAYTVRESGYKDIPGILKNVKAIGWYMDEYNAAQISMNLTNIEETPVHVVFEEVARQAVLHGTEVTGSELIGLIPLTCLLEAGIYFKQKQGLLADAAEDELVETAVKELGLDSLGPFDSKQRVIEYLLM
ncbi:glutamate formimidoyltransferase [Mucilaginibacter limnophilus]|uniref:glutamate formimidoyltransferase n=1 Tax=Mucilaginibacter limnophilus TaxID=1932778 RepID=A0A437MQV7_9SPHI|nr:glutamate formimidoyltransferase [Mucilaginibacter limnophilus]RVU00008.1 glutamate formimidoyltransferase [Mucilaginibacter limnophilus]